MKKLLHLALVVASYYFSTTTLFAQANWQSVGPLYALPVTSDYTATIFFKNTQYVAFSDQNDSGKISVIKYDGTTWESVGLLDFSAGDAEYCSIAVDTAGVPYVAYQDIANGKKITVQKYVNNKWTIVGPVGFSHGEAYFTSIVISKRNTKYVSYEDRAFSYKGVVKKYNNDSSNWIKVGSDTACTNGTAQYLSMTVSDDDIPYIAYQNGNDSEKATVKKFCDNQWRNVGSVGISNGISQWTQIALLPSGNPVIDYTDWFTPAGQLTVMEFNGTKWFPVGVAISSGEAYFVTIATDCEGDIYAGYADWGDYVGEATVLEYVLGSNQWNPVGAEGFTPGEADYISLALNSEGTPYIASSENAQGSPWLVSVMDYPSITVSCVTNVRSTPTNNGKLSVWPNPAHNQFTVDFPIATSQLPVSLTIYDIQGKRVFEKVLTNSQEFHETISTNDWAAGMYFLVVQGTSYFAKTKVLIQ